MLQSFDLFAARLVVGLVFVRFMTPAMSVALFDNDAEYRRWLTDHPDGFVVNTTSTLSPKYMVLHRARCPYVSEPMHEKASGGFTERDYTKVAAEDIETLRNWVALHGRADKTFSKECGRCNPTDRFGPRWQPVAAAGKEVEFELASGWEIWEPGEVVYQVEGIKPLLASWEKGTDAAQVRLRAYLDDVIPQLTPLPEASPLFLHLDVDVEHPRRMLRHYDLENYLTPLFGSRWLPANRFSLVSARKYVGGGSRILCGLAIPKITADEDSWTTCEVSVGRGASLGIWKERLRESLAAACPNPLPAGPAQVRIAWRCSAKRNWSNLWKPTGDAMAPVLGAVDPDKPYQLDDDRIVHIEFQRNIDDSIGHDIVVGYWWRPLAPG